MTGAGAQISVILPAYNVSAYVAAAIDSLQRQRFAGFEALVIDDGSTDDTAEQARQAIGNDPRFQLIRQQNRGLSGARNTGLDRASAPFVAFLDGDDRLDPDFLQALHDDVQANSRAPWVACGVTFCAADGSHHSHSAIHGQPELAPQSPATAYDLADWRDVIRHFPSAWNKLYRRDFVGDLRFDEGLWYEDHGFFHRLAAHTPVLRHVPRPLYLYTLAREGQITRADSERVFEQFTVLDTSARIFATSAKTGADAGLARLATRLMCERLDAIHTPERAARFRDAARRFFARHQIAPDWQWDRYLSALQVLHLTTGAHIAIRADPADAPAQGLLPNPNSPLAPLIQLCPPDQPPAPNALCIDLPAGAQIDHAALVQAADALLHGDLAAVLVPLTRLPAEVRAPDPSAPALPPHALTPDGALDPDPAHHAILSRPAFASDPALRDPQQRLTDQALRLCAAAASVAWVPTPLAPAYQPAAPTFRTSLASIAAFPPHLAQHLPPGWQRRLALRAAVARGQTAPQQGPWLRRLLQLVPVLQLCAAGLRHGWIGAPGKVDADTPPPLRRIFRLPPIG